MSYQVWSVVFGEQPSASKWNILGSNDASFNDGTGIANDAIIARHLANDAVETAAIDNGAVTADKLGNGAASASVTTSQTTTSTSYTDLATVGPAVTVTIGANGLALVTFMAYIQHAVASGNTGWVSFAMSGANTLAASDSYALMYQTWTANAFHQGGVSFMLTGLNPGSTTFTLKYRGSSANTTTYKNRRLSVTPL